MSPERKRVSMLFLAVLGRPVESEETVTSMAPLAAAELLRGLVASEEFRELVFAPLSQNLQIRQELLDEETLAAVLNWAQREEREYFKDYRRELDTIHSVLDGLLSFGDMKASLDQPDWDEFFARLSDRRRGIRRLIGVVEEINQKSCRGYVLDASDPDRDLFIRLKVNGLTVAVLPALDYRRDLQAGYGGSGRCGFSITFSDLLGSDQLDEGTIDLEEASSGFVLLKSERIIFSRHKLIALRDEVKASLRAYRSEVDALIRQLSVGEGHAASTIKDYAASLPFRPAQPAPDLAKPVSVLIEVSGGAEPGALAATLSALLAEGPSLGTVITLFYGSTQDGVQDATARYREVLDRFGGLGRSGGPLKVLVSGDGSDHLRDAVLGCGAASRLVLLAAGERLDPGALAWFDLGLRDPSARIAYADSDVVSPGDQPEPVFRAAFDPDLLLTCDEYDTPVCLSARDVARPNLEGAVRTGNLRFAMVVDAYEAFGGTAFRHVPLVLSRSGVDVAADERRRARACILVDHLDHTAPGASLKPHEDRITRPLPDRCLVVWPEPKVRETISVVILTKDGMDMVLSLLGSLKSNTGFLSALRIIVVSNNSRAPQTAPLLEALSRDPLVTIVEDHGPFNWSRLNDEVIRGRIEDGLVLCLNNDMICHTPDWDQLLRAQLARRDVGIVGGRLLFPNGALQHAGITMHGGWAHEGAGDFPQDGLYRNRTRVVHDAYGVTGAFLGFAKATYDGLGGFDVEHLPEAFNDVEFCLKCRSAGQRVIYDPAQVWAHFESISRGFDQFQPHKEARNVRAVRLIRERYGAFADQDLTYNPHFARAVRPYSLLHWPDAREVEAWVEAQGRAIPVVGKLKRAEPDDPRQD